MKKKSKMLGVIIIFLIVMSFGTVYSSSDMLSNISKVEYTEEYKEYLKLSDEEKTKILEPNRYDIITNQNNQEYLKKLSNPFKMSRLLKSTFTSSYTLQNIIPENMTIKNQMNTNTCWAFATIGILESNLAMQDKINSKAPKIYDFSERHMIYGSLRYAFLNNAENIYGVNKKVLDGGNFFIASMYLSNGSGAVLESDLPFENSENNIDISKIQNKTIQTTLKDTVLFGTPSTEAERRDIMDQIKQHITNYGGVYSGIHGAKPLSGCYNNRTGAVYCKEHNADHSIIIIGWDDNYNRDNFINKPSANGAWIIKNSWGQEISRALLEIKEDYYNKYTSDCIERGWNSVAEISNDFIVSRLEDDWGKGKVRLEGSEIKIKIGNNGFMYVSYEDKNIYSSLAGIEKVTAKKDYLNIYQNDELGWSQSVQIDSNHVYIANVFQRNTQLKEAVDRISVTTLQEYNCKVYINPNGNSKASTDLKPIKLKGGDSVTIKPGYRTLEFTEPVTLKGDKFVIVVELITDQNNAMIPLESKSVRGWEEASVNTEESFITTTDGFTKDKWTDLVAMPAEGLKGNACIKAFTIQEMEVTLDSIAIIKSPARTNYTEGEDFDKAGMQIKARYSNGVEKEITNYIITNGNNLTTNQSSVIINYTENGITKTATQMITVNARGLIMPEPNKEPISSDFNKAVATATNTEVYFYKTKNKETYVTMKVKISNIKIGDKDNKYTYYYYLSGEQGEENIANSNWNKVEADKETDGTYSINIDINTRDIKNIKKISESDKLFVYIKEIAQINNKTQEQMTTMNLENQSRVSIYLDDKKVDSINVTTKEENNKEIEEDKKMSDNTVALGKIPQTGTTPVILGIIIITLAIGAFAYYKLKSIDK